MNNNIYYLHDKPKKIAQYTRVGFSDHHQVEQLLSAGKMPVQRFVIEAANFSRQLSLVRTLQDENAEIVLDTNAAELSTKGRFSGSAAAAPWAINDRPLEFEDFQPGTNRSIIEPIAEFAIKNKLSSVMAPTHYLGEGQTGWFSTDIQACNSLRSSLNRMGGSDISVDYPLIITYAQFRDPNFRRKAIDSLKYVDFDQLWLKVSGFGADATPAGVERFIKGLFEFHELERPIIVDQVGGLTSLGLCAFGASSGFSHGISGKERFAATGWINPSQKKGGFGGGKTIFIPSLDRRLKINDVRQLFNDARASRNIFGCSNKSCCRNVEHMLRNPERHFMVQRGIQVSDLSQAPETVRIDYFLNHHVRQAREKTDRAMNFKKTSVETKAKIFKAQKRLHRFEDSMKNLQEQLGPTNFALESKVRTGNQLREGWGVEGQLI